MTQVLPVPELSEEVELGHELWELEKKKKALSEELKSVGELYNFKAGLLRDYLVEQGKNSTGHIEGVGTFSLRRSYYPTVSKANLSRFIEFVKERGHGGIVKETIEAATLKAYINDRIEELIARYADDPSLMDTHAREAELEDGSPSEVATAWLGKYGVAIWDEIKVSHRNKGK